MQSVRYYLKAIAYFKAMENLGLAQYDRKQGIMLSPNIPEKDQPVALEAAEAYERVVKLLGRATWLVKKCCLTLVAIIAIKAVSGA